MISLQKLEKNKAKYIETVISHGIADSKLLDFLGDDLFVAPATPNRDYYGCYPGGLVSHLLKLCKYSILVNDLLPKEIRLDKTKLIKVSLLCQIGKAFMFEENSNEWARINQGMLYKYKSNDVSMRPGERSVYYAVTHGVKLDEDEYQTILNFDKSEEDKMAKYHSSILNQVIKQAFDLAVIEEKHT